VTRASDFDCIASNIAIWHEYDPAVKAELYSTCLATSDGMYLIDPVRLQRQALGDLIGSGSVSGIIVTNANHRRASNGFAEEFAVPILAHADSFPQQPSRSRKISDGDEICSRLRVVAVEGAAIGEIVLHYAADGGTLIVGDALINFEPYGFAFLPAKYCSNQKELRRSLRKLLNYKAKRMLFAHGAPIISGASDRLRGLLNSDR
jgi:glyoxylase-like metal-dependent hydrolase (beta-lactamase superfamily II)